MAINYRYKKLPIREKAFSTLYFSVIDKNEEGKPCSWDDCVKMIQADSSVACYTRAARAALGRGDKAAYDSNKKRLPLLCPSVVIEGRRRQAGITALLPYFFIDLDHLSPQQYATFRDLLADDPHVLLLSDSCSGSGLHLMLRGHYAMQDGTPWPADWMADGCRQITMMHHVEAWMQARAYVCRLLAPAGLSPQEAAAVVDPRVKDPSRACFLAHDDHPVYRPDAVPLELTLALPHEDKKDPRTGRQLTDEETALLLEMVDKNVAERAERAARRHGTDESYRPGNRNRYGSNWLYEANRQGVPLHAAIAYMRDHYADMPDLDNVARSIYAGHQEEHAVYRPRNIARVAAGTACPPRRRACNREEMAEALSQLETLRFDQRRNQLQRQVPESGEWVELTERYAKSLMLELEHVTGSAISDNYFYDVLTSDTIPTYDRYDDCFAYAKAHRWHKEKDPDYIQQFFHRRFVMLPGYAYCEEWFTRMYVSIVATLLGGNPTEMVYILFGPQMAGKTTYCRNLLPPMLQDDILVKPHSGESFSKDEQINFGTKAVIDLEEEDSIDGRYMSALKGFVTLKSITVRRPFCRNAERMPRRCVLMSTTNNERFLYDSSGLRRFMVLPVQRIDSMDISQQEYDDLFRQAYWLWKDGYRYWFERDESELLNDIISQYKIHTTEYLRVKACLRNMQSGEEHSPDLHYWNVDQIMTAIGTSYSCRLDHAKVKEALHDNNIAEYVDDDDVHIYRCVLMHPARDGQEGELGQLLHGGSDAEKERRARVKRNRSKGFGKEGEEQE